MRRNVRLVLPGEWVLDRDERPRKVHHVEVLGHLGRYEIALCLSKGPHPAAEAARTSPWPIMWFDDIDAEVEVVPTPPRVAVEWNGSDWAVRSDQ